MQSVPSKRFLVSALLLTVSVYPAVALQGTPAETPAQAQKQFVPPGPQPVPEPKLLPPPPPIEELTADRTPAFEGSDYLLGRVRQALPPPQIPTVLAALIGFAALLAATFLAGHPVVERLERQFNVAHLLTTGLPFFMLGVFASQPQVGVLTPAVLNEVAPIIPLALGWLGFAIGARFRAQGADQLSPEVGNSFAAATLIPLVLVFMACSATILWIHPDGSRTSALRDALLLATAGTMAARSSPQFLRVFSGGAPASDRSGKIIELEQLAGVFGLLLVSAYFRPSAELVTWHLPGTAWLFVTLGIGTTMGVFSWLALSRAAGTPQFTAVFLGAVAFTAGMGSFLRLSPLSVCFIAGAIAAYLGSSFRDEMIAMLGRLERPVYFLFMVIAGALWNPSEWQGWVLMVVFIGARQVSKWIAALYVGYRILPDATPDERRTLTFAPMGALSVAIIMSAQDLYSGPTISWIVTAVLAGALVMEFALQIAVRRVTRGSASPAFGAAGTGDVD